jgi:hypothetical protein
MAGYRDLLRTPGVARIIAAQLTARFPNGMTSLAILLHIEQVKALGYLQAPVVITDEDHWSGFRPDKIDELASRLA